MVRLHSLGAKPCPSIPSKNPGKVVNDLLGLEVIIQLPASMCSFMISGVTEGSRVFSRIHRKIKD